MFTTINNNKHKHICTLDIVYVKKRHNADYGTLLKWNVIHGRKGFFCRINAHCCRELLETQVYISYLVCCHSNDHTAARAYPLLENK